MERHLTLNPFTSTDLAEAFSHYKVALMAVIEATFGWNEEFQKERFQSRYKLDWFHWIDIGHQRIGYICYFEKETEMHVSLLIINSDQRNRGYGYLVMDHIHNEARRRGCTVTLSSFRKNEAANRFYKRLGYVLVGGDDYFVDMAKKSDR